jgi:predicted RNase H-like nuclease
MPAEVFVGFDSAWTDNERAPGAICALSLSDRSLEFVAPQLARFSEAATLIEDVAGPDDFLLVALDQPTRVPNQEGCRPVERVAGSVVSRLAGGVQPARRGGGGACMFGDEAPLWRFLDRLAARESPIECRSAERGRYLIEVFPALALPLIVPEIWERRRAAKYNPAAAKFQPADWPLVCRGAALFADSLKAGPVASWLRTASAKANPRKSDQDKLDAVLCLLIGVAWRRAPAERSIVLGDLQSGYIVSPVSPSVRAMLESSARLRDVPVGDPGLASPNPTRRAPPRPTTRHRLPEPRVRQTAAPRSSSERTSRFRLGAEDLRAFLVQVARRGELVSYGDVATQFGQPWTQGFGSSLGRALSEMDTQSRASNEPSLMCLVVNRQTRLPGQGYFIAIGLAEASLEDRIAAHERSRDECRHHSWD